MCVLFFDINRFNFINTFFKFDVVVLVGDEVSDLLLPGLSMLGDTFVVGTVFLRPPFVVQFAVDQFALD